MKWKTLQHNGILFPPAYESQGIKIKIKGEVIALDITQEEMAYQWAKKKDTPYAQDKVFQKNFTADFAKSLGSKFKKLSYEDIDFSNAYKIVDKEKDLKEMMTKEEKKSIAAKRKELREKLKIKFGIKTTMIEPGVIKTNFFNSMKVPESKIDPKYKTLTDNILAGLKMMVEMGTAPSQVAEVVMKAIHDDEMQPRYVVGTDAAMFMEAKKMKTDLEFEKYMSKELFP
jgi:hypothetical protein